MQQNIKEKYILIKYLTIFIHKIRKFMCSCNVSDTIIIYIYIYLQYDVRNETRILNKLIICYFNLPQNLSEKPFNMFVMDYRLAINVQAGKLSIQPKACSLLSANLLVGRMYFKYGG